MSFRVSCLMEAEGVPLRARHGHGQVRPALPVRTAARIPRAGNPDRPHARHARRVARAPGGPVAAAGLHPHGAHAGLLPAQDRHWRSASTSGSKSRTQPLGHSHGGVCLADHPGPLRSQGHRARRASCVHSKRLEPFWFEPGEDAATVQPREHEQAPSEVRFIYVGRLSPEKDVPTLLRAFESARARCHRRA